MRNELGNLSGKAFFHLLPTHVNCVGCMPGVGGRLGDDSAKWNVNEVLCSEISGNVLGFC